MIHRQFNTPRSREVHILFPSRPDPGQKNQNELSLGRTREADFMVLDLRIEAF